MFRFSIVLLTFVCCIHTCISIKGGYAVKSWDKYSFMVALFAGNQAIECGGALIHPMFVLTAAHCFCNENLELLTIAVAQDAWQRDHIEQSDLRAVEKVHLHPGFSCHEVEKQAPVDDLALLQLSAPIPEDIGTPVSIITQSFSDDQAISVELLGWGEIAYKQPSSVLRAVETELWPAYRCRNKLHRYQMVKNQVDLEYDKLHHYDQRQICTNGTMNGAPTDSAKGDSGGPVILRAPGKQPVLIGVISSSLNDTSGDRKNPGVNVNITYYAEWIKDIIGPEQKTDSTVLLTESTFLPMDSTRLPTHTTVLPTDTGRVEAENCSVIRAVNTTFFPSDFELNHIEIIELLYTSVSMLILLGIMHFGGKDKKFALFSKEWWWSGTSAESASVKGVLLAGLGYAVTKLAVVCGYCAQSEDLWTFKRFLKILVCSVAEIVIITVEYFIIRKLKNDKKLGHNNPIAGGKTVHIASANKSIEEIQLKKDWVTNGARYLDRLNDLKPCFSVDSCSPVLVKLLEGFSLAAPEGLASARLKYSTEKWNEHEQFVMLCEAHPIPGENERRNSDVLLAQCYGSQILEALDFLHKRNLTHGALDLTTVFVDTSTNTIKIYGYLDRKRRIINRDSFGPDHILWQAFLAPESLFELIQESSTYTLSTKSDMWSFACVMVYLLSNAFTFTMDKFQRERKNYAIKFNVNGNVCEARRPGLIVDYVKRQAHLSYDDIRGLNVRELLDRCFSMNPDERMDAPAALEKLPHGQNPLIRFRQ